VGGRFDIQERMKIPDSVNGIISMLSYSALNFSSL
jgi:hypothetical protein